MKHPLSPHHLLRRGLILTAIFLAALILAIASLMGARVLPQGQLVTRIKAASRFLVDEHPYDSPLSRALHLPFTNYSWSRDNGTDSTMLSVMLPQKGKPALYSAMDDEWAQLSHLYKPHQFPQQSVVALSARLTGMRPVEPVSYARYWHGYQVITQPLLRIMSYAQTRILNMLLLTLCLIATLIVIARFVSRTVAVAFTAVLLLAGCYIVPLSWQFVAVSYIALAGMVAAALLGRKLNWPRFDLELFFILGIVTVFFDFFTIPLITLGLPLLMILVMMWQDSARRAAFARDSRKEVLRATSAWLSGYALFWVAKWVVASVLLKQNVVQNAIQEIFLRGGTRIAPAGTLAGSAHRSNVAPSGLLSVFTMRFESVFKNLAALIPGRMIPLELALRSALAVVLIALAFALWSLLRSKRRAAGATLCSARQASSFLVVGAFPLVWYFVLANHSILNYWFTYRLLVVTLFALALFFICTLVPTPAPDVPGTADFIEFDSMINLRPAQNNRSRSVEAPALQEKIKELIAEVVHG